MISPPTDPVDPCLHCKESRQACAYILNGRNVEDACLDKYKYIRLVFRGAFDNEAES